MSSIECIAELALQLAIARKSERELRASLEKTTKERDEERRKNENLFDRLQDAYSQIRKFEGKE